METKTDFHLAPENVRRAVEIALEIGEKPRLKTVSLKGAPTGTVFEVPILPGSWGRVTLGLEHPHTGVRRPITFDHDVAKGRDEVVLAHLEHGLVRMCLRLLREELWKLDDIKRLHRVIVKSVPDGELNGPAVAIWSRLVVTGAGHHRLHEELTLSGGELKTSGFSRITQVGRLESFVEDSSPVEPSQSSFEELKNLFVLHEESIRAAVEARSRDRLKYLENTLRRRKDSEIEDLVKVLDDLERNIGKELEEGELPNQMTLPGFDDDERDQIRRDVLALKARLERIPEEKVKESEAIEKRYANPIDRTFPIAVVFLVPEARIKRS
jgi:hypothetical protein